MNDLTLEVGRIDDIIINKSDSADTGCGKIKRNRGAKSVLASRLRASADVASSAGFDRD